MFLMARILKRDLLEGVSTRLHSTAIHLLRAARRDDESFGLSAARLSALSVVVFGGPLSLGSLAAAEQVRPPTMTKLVQGLERAGLVERTADPADRRVSIVHATPRGVRLLEGAQRRRVEAIAGLLAGLSLNELEVLDRAADLVSGELATGKWVSRDSQPPPGPRRRR